MDIQTEKLELVRMILDTDNSNILLSVKRISQTTRKLIFGIVYLNLNRKKSLKD